MRAKDAERVYLEDLRTRRAKSWPKGLPDRPDYPLGEIPITEYLRERARQHPDKVAYIFYGREITFGELDTLSERFAAHLLRSGVEPGDRCAVYLPNCPQFIISFYGILKAGCVHVPVNPMFRDEELEYELQDADPKVVVTLDTLLDRLARVVDRSGVEQIIATSLAEYLPDTPSIPVPEDMHERRPTSAPSNAIGWNDLVGVDAEPLQVQPELNWLAALNYTGGTTGMPKGCMHTHGNMLYTAATASTYGFMGASDEISVVFIPIFWIAGEDVGILLPIFAGSTCILLARWDVDAVLAAISQYRATAMLASMDNYVAIMDHERIEEFDLTSLRTPLAMSLVRKVSLEYRRKWFDVAGSESILREGAYGMTETHTIDTITLGFQENDYDVTSAPIFCGLPMPGTEFKILDFESEETEPVGAEGEIVIRSPSLFTGYWRSPDRTATSLADGWLRTGDIGFIDQEGILHFLGRRKEMLKVNGMSVFPAEVEALLGRMPAIARCAVVGRPDEQKGEIPVAYIQLNAGSVDDVDEASLAAWCKDHMAPYKVPRIRFVADLPLTATGKIKKDLLPAD